MSNKLKATSSTASKEPPPPLELPPPLGGGGVMVFAATVMTELASLLLPSVSFAELTFVFTV